MFEVRVRKTIVGYTNVTLVNHPEQPRVTLSPEQFSNAFPELSQKLRFGWHHISYRRALEIFGEKISTYNEAKTA